MANRTNRKFVVNLSTRTVHRLPSNERCNVDQIPTLNRRYFPTMPAWGQIAIGKRRYFVYSPTSAAVPVRLRRCGHCFAGDR